MKHAAYVEAVEAARQDFEVRLAPRVARVLRSEAERVADAVAQAGPDGSPYVAADFAVTEETARDLLLGIYGQVAPVFGQAAYDALLPAKRTLPDWLTLVRVFLGAKGGAMIRSITETARETYRAILEVGVASGEGMDELARRLRREAPDLSILRAQRIVRTEVIAASNFGSQVGAAATGLDLVREWLDTDDGRTRHSHRATGGQQRPMGVPYEVGGEGSGVFAMYPGDPDLPARERIACRCCEIYVPPEAAKAAAAVSWRDERAAAIRAAYPALRAKEGQLEALELLSKQHACSVSTVKRALWPSR